MALIDKETICKEIERRMTENCALAGKADCFGQRAVEDNDILAFLDTLPEQPVTECHDLEKGLDVDLEKEVTKFVLSKEYIEGKETPVLLTARHFYDLGCRHTAVMYDDIEYERQRAEEAENEEFKQEDINTEMGHWMSCLDDKYCMLVNHYSIQDIKDTARHFAEWGAEHLKK